MLFESIDQTVTQDAKGLQRNHKHVLFPAMQFLPPVTVLSNQSQANNKHAYISMAPRLINC